MNLKKLHKKLIDKKLTISIAESCTGGLLSNNLTKLANSSKYFQMGLITYSNEAKIKILKVNKNIIKKYGAVSKECCEAMVRNLSKISKKSIWPLNTLKDKAQNIPANQQTKARVIELVVLLILPVSSAIVTSTSSSAIAEVIAAKVTRVKKATKTTEPKE